MRTSDILPAEMERTLAKLARVIRRMRRAGMDADAAKVEHHCRALADVFGPTVARIVDVDGGEP